MDDNANIDCSPFRRFPWVQLVFCLACLTMTVWTWMRYSYVWDVVPEEFWKESDHMGSYNPVIEEKSTGEVVVAERYMNHALAGYFLRVRGPSDCVGVQGGIVHVGWPGRMDVKPSPTAAFEGRARVETMTGGFFAIVLDTSDSRLHGASVAGLVVGAMGCFIFGLYLRRWLREK